MPTPSGLRVLPVAAAQALAALCKADMTLYLPGPDGRDPVLYREANAGLAAPDFCKLAESGVSSLLLRVENLVRCEEVLEENISSILHNPSLAAPVKSECVRQVAVAIAHDILAGPTEAVNAGRATKLLDCVISSVLADPAVAAGLLNMSEHHRTTAGHMFAVSTLSILLGSEMFGADEARLRELGLAGMLHDLGKMSIKPEILNKTEPLEPHEIQLIHQHPIESVRLVGDNTVITPEVRAMILQHHERLDGRGYPLGLTARDLLPGTKILSLVDAFHAMIGRRSYRAPLRPAEAHRLLAYVVGSQFDPDVYAAWERMHRRRGRVGGAGPGLEHDAASATAFHIDHVRMASSQRVTRKAPRLDCRNRVIIRCCWAGQLHGCGDRPREFSSPLVDLSRGGACIETEHPC